MCCLGSLGQVKMLFKVLSTSTLGPERVNAN